MRGHNICFVVKLDKQYLNYSQYPFLSGALTLLNKVPLSLYAPVIIVRERYVLPLFVCLPVASLKKKEGCVMSSS